MFKFRGFRASLDFLTGKQRSHDIHTSSVTSLGGAYKINRDEFGGSVIPYSPPRTINPSVVKLPPSPHSNQAVKSKSTSDLVQSTSTVEATRSTQDLSQNSRASKRRAKEQKKLDKQQLEAQKRQERLAAKERERQEKLAKKNRQTNNAVEARESVESVRSRKKRNAPVPPQNQPVPIPRPQANNPTSRNIKEIQPINQELHGDIQQSLTIPSPPTTYSTNTLESSISRSSGPPPYGEYPEIIIDDPSTNITFSKPVDYSSWDLISEHRQQIGKPAASVPVAPKRKKDLQYNVGNLRIMSDGQTDV